MSYINKNITIYSLKTFACFFVIILHINYSGNNNILLFNIAKFAVPLFFMISGYFSFYDDEEMNKIISKRIIKILILIVFSSLLYFFLNLAINIKHNLLNDYILNIKNIKNIIKFVFLNWTTPIFGVGHLWYLFALLYVYLIVKIVNKYNLYKISYILSLIFIIGIIFFEYYNSHNNLNISQIYYRNAWIMGFSFFMLGRYIKEYENKFIVSNSKLLIIILISVFSIYFLYKFEYRFMNNDNCLFINNILLCLLLFIIAINWKNINILSNIGKADSGYIYIIHYAVIRIMDCFLGLPKSFHSNFILPFLVFAISAILSYFYRKTKLLLLNK